MALSKDRIVSAGQTPHLHEREALEFAVAQLPDLEPFRLWAFTDLIDLSGGRRYDLDLLVIGYHALYLIEVKSHPGTLAGDDVDWQFTFPDGGRSLVENPLRTTNYKAKVLASLLARQFGKDAASRSLRPPWVQPLVFLSNASLAVKLTPAGRMNVVTRDTFVRAITHGEFPGASETMRDRFINKPTGTATYRALLALGLKASVQQRKVEGLLLRELLEDGSHYQDHLGVHQSVDTLKRRVRSYLLPSTTSERREQLLRAARREAQYLTALSDHKNILRLVDYVAEGPLGGPCVILEHFEDALPLDAFLRGNPGLAFEHRVTIIQQVAEALEFCHRKQIVHRGLNPRAILVRQAAGADGKPLSPEVRLYNFQLAAADDTSGTVHLTAFTQDQAAVYLAPEVLRDPANADAASDVFSLGALAYFVLTGRPPGSTLAERAELLANGHLSIAAVRDDLAGGAAAQSLDEVVAFATEMDQHLRADSAISWLNLLLEAVTSSEEPDQGFAHPLHARRDDRLTPDMQVVDILGSGSTALVLRVRRQDGDYALKVSLSPELDERLRQEARVLEALRSDRIVALEEELTLHDRTCLLMTDAGDTLATLISREGPPSLDFARRWGEDLLRALEALEDKGVQHRDIKPANLGVLSGQAKKKRSLLLFDFSLAGVTDTAITAGTPAYRDPFLDRRGRWDAAADRWSAAISLHELLTGTRPRWAADEGPTPAGGEEMRIAAERFDATVRSRLVAFFKRALEREVGQRFTSAEEMRVEWVSCFATAAYGDAPDTAAPAQPPDFSALTPATPIAALPLSARAKNALDRAGMTQLGEVLRMPRNRLSTTRGIGRITHQEILKFIDDARRALGAQLAPEAEVPFCPDYAGGAFPVGLVPGLSIEAAAALEDAGLGQLPNLAAASRAQVERLLLPHPGAGKALSDHLTAGGSGGTPALGAPTTVEDWLEPLFGSGHRPKFLQTTRQLLGLEPAPGETEAVGPLEARALAGRLGSTQAAVHISFAKARDGWRDHPHTGDLHAKVAAAVERLGGVGSLSRVAEALLFDLPHRAGASVSSPDLAAEALVRVGGEISSSLVLGRIDGHMWMAAGQGTLALARRLGVAADELSAREPLPSTEEVRAVLAEIVAESPLAMLPPERLVALAADASRRSARSARLELYPRDMSAARAVVLSAGALSPQLATPESVRKIVLARYPEAQPPPERPALDELLAPLGLAWDDNRGQYVRPTLVAATTSPTRHLQRQPTTHTSHRPPRASRESQEALEFDAGLRLAVEKRNLRVLDVTAGYDELAAEEVARRTRARCISLEREVLAETERLMAELGIDSQVVFEADHNGPSAPEDWENLRNLVRKAAERVLDRIVVAGGMPLVLTQPGILARYRLDDVVVRLVRRSQDDDAPPIFVVNPTDDAAPPAVIDASPRPLPIPLTSQAQRLKVPEPWIRNEHRGGPL